MNFKNELPVNLRMVVNKFMVAAGDTIDEYNTRQLARHTANQLQQLAAKMAMLDNTSLRQFALHLSNISTSFKDGAFDHSIERIAVNDDNRAAMAVLDINVCWFTYGVLNSTGCDVNACISEACSSYLSKIVNGVVNRDSLGNVENPEGWTQPDLLDHVYPIDIKPRTGRSSGFAELNE